MQLNIDKFNKWIKEMYVEVDVLNWNVDENPKCLLTIKGNMDDIKKCLAILVNNWDKNKKKKVHNIKENR